MIGTVIDIESKRQIIRLTLNQILVHTWKNNWFFQGDTDFVASTKTVEEVVDASKNNNLKVHIVENTGHMPGIMMMEKLMDVLTDLAKII